MTTEIESAVGRANTQSAALVERSKVDYATMSEQIAQAEDNISHNDSLIASARETIRLAQEGNRNNRTFIRDTRRKMRKVARFRFDMEQIEEGN